MNGKNKRGENKRRKDKRGVVRVIEAVVGVLLVLLGLVYFVSQQAKTLGKEEKAREVLRLVLSEIEKNETIREYIITNNKVQLNNSLRSIFANVASQYDFNFCITQPDLMCIANTPNKDVFVDSLFISFVDKGNINATKLVLFIWQK